MVVLPKKERLHEPKSEALRSLFWREEILQLIFWIESEGFGDSVDADLLQRFLGIDSDFACTSLDRLAAEGLLLGTAPGRYELSEEGRGYGQRLFADDLVQLTNPARGECGPHCWCHASLEEAEVCTQGRLNDRHAH